MSAPTPLSVHDWRVLASRQRQAQQRNPKTCPCARRTTVEVSTAKLGMKRVMLTRHGTIHGIHGEGCVHSQLAATTKRYRPARAEDRSPFAVGARKARLRRRAAMPSIPVIVLQ